MHVFKTSSNSKIVLKSGSAKIDLAHMDMLNQVKSYYTSKYLSFSEMSSYILLLSSSVFLKELFPILKNLYNGSCKFVFM